MSSSANNDNNSSSSSSSSPKSMLVPSSPPPSLLSLSSSSSSMLPPFSLTGDKYDQGTYYGRFRKMLDLVDPRTLLCTEHELDEARRLLQTYKEYGTTTITNTNNGTTTSTTTTTTNDNAKLWQAKHIIDSMTHPDTNELIPQPFRMSGYLPYNAPICVGALVASSPYSILFWQWSNQTHNALINYYNSNKTQPVNMTTVAQGYVGAVSGACGVSLGLKTFIDRSRYDVTKKIKLQRFVALPAIITAAAMNVILMRRNELTTGINVYYEVHSTSGTTTTNNNNTNNSSTNVDRAAAPDRSTSSSGGTTTTVVVVGSSQIAARKALKEMTLSRMMLPLPIFLSAPLGMAGIDALAPHSPTLQRLLHQRPTVLSVACNTIFVLVSFGVGLPATIALFPQIGTIPVSDLEERFQHLRDTTTTGQPIQSLHYNKGL